jgi:hypothetical protein
MAEFILAGCDSPTAAATLWPQRGMKTGVRSGILVVPEWGKGIRSVDKRAAQLLEDCHWPGSIRELQNVIQRAAILCGAETLAVERHGCRQLPRTCTTFSRGAPAGEKNASKRFSQNAVAAFWGRTVLPKARDSANDALPRRGCELWPCGTGGVTGFAMIFGCSRIETLCSPNCLIDSANLSPDDVYREIRSREPRSSPKRLFGAGVPPTLSYSAPGISTFFNFTSRRLRKN